MFLGLCALALIALVPLTGGSLTRVAALPFRGVRLLLAALVLQVLVISVFTSLPRIVAVVGHIGSYAMLAVVLWLNRRLPEIGRAHV